MISYVQRKKGQAFNHEENHQNCEAWGWQHRVLWVICFKQDRCISENKWYPEEVGFSKVFDSTARMLKLCCNQQDNVDFKIIVNVARSLWEPFSSTWFKLNAI